MGGTRRYDDDEVAEILQRATSERATSPVLPTKAGLTLSDLEQIGAEVGIQPGRIADAARSIGRTSHGPAPERYLGAPRSVSRTLKIDRDLTDQEWGRLVADLRRTFNATGKVESRVGLRSWTNSNLQVHVEPDGDGYEVRMTTRKGNATQCTLMGVAFTIMGVAVGIGALWGTTDDTLAKAFIFAGIGVGAIAWVRATLPSWAKQRAEQMEALAQRIPLLLRE